MTTLLAAIDAGPLAGTVVATAEAMLPVFADELDVVTVDHDDGSLDAAIAQDVRSLAGRTGPAIVAEIEDDGVAAIVVGLRSVAGGPRPAGHVTEHVITHCEVPVVVVPPGVDPAANPLERVLVPVEGSEPLGPEAESLLHRLESLGSLIETIHVFDRATVPMFWDGWHERELFADQFAEQYLPLEEPALELRAGDVAQQILAAAEASGSTLIVLEWKRDLGGTHAPVVRDLLGNTPVPLVLFPTNCRGATPS